MRAKENIVKTRQWRLLLTKCCSLRAVATHITFSTHE